MNHQYRYDIRAQVVYQLRRRLFWQTDGNKPAGVSFAQMMKQLRGEG